MDDIVGFIIFLLVGPRLVILFEKVVDIFVLLRRLNYDKNRFKHGLVDIEDLHNLTPHEFKEWCGEFLEKCGYADIHVTPDGKDGGKDIICKEGEDSIYVECKRYGLDLSSPYKIHTEIIKKLVGAMVHDGIHKGIVITTGIVTKDARLFVNALSAPYSIQIIDSEMLIEKCIQHEIYLSA